MGTGSIISLSEAVRRLGIHIDLNDGPLVDTNRKTADIMCPMCSPQHRTKRRTLNLDFVKNVFGCNRCDFRGGVYKFIAPKCNCNPAQTTAGLAVTSAQSAARSLPCGWPSWWRCVPRCGCRRISPRSRTSPGLPVRPAGRYPESRTPDW